MTPLFRKFLGLNWVLFVTMLGLLVFGVFCVHSASWMREEPAMANLWKKQTQFVCIGLVVYFVASLIDYKWIRWAGIPFYLLGIGLLIATIFVGVDVYGHQGWLQIGGLQFQPSQVAMASGIVLIAFALSSMHHLHPFFRYHFVRLIAAGLIGGIPCLMVLGFQKDFGSAIVWGPVILSMILVGSIPFRYIIVIGLCVTMLLPFGFYFGLKDYQKERITVQIDMLRGKKVDTQGAAWAANNNLTAIGSGGWSGRGFKKLDTMTAKGFIPKTTAINDFIFAVLAEAHGFRGSLLMLSGFLLLLLQCLFVAFYSRDMMGRLLVVGVVGLFFAHIFQNVGMNLLIMPITGIPLPLISYGGTFLVMVMGLLGLVQSVWVHRVDRDEPAAPSGMEIDHLD